MDKKAPNGGVWYDEWQSDYLCPTPGFNTYRHAIEIDPEPTLIMAKVGELSAICGIKCDYPETGEDHPVERKYSWEEGWSISGSFSGDTGELWKVLKLGVGISASYSQKQEVTDVIKHKFPHCDRDGVVRWWSVPIYQVEKTYTAKVWRYYKNARGGMMQDRDGGWYRTPQGSVSWTYHFYLLGTNEFSDKSCEEWKEIIPKGNKKAVIGRVKNVSQIREFTEQSQEFALRSLSKRIKLKNHDKAVLNAILGNDNDKIEEIIDEIGINYENVTEETETLAWLISNRDIFEFLSDNERKLIKKSFNL
ncbi:MAG: hypothetical protein ACK5M7_08275 [Draconibacterium sp.]